MTHIRQPLHLSWSTSTMPSSARLYIAPGRAGRDAGRVQAVLADPGQVEHEGLLEFQLHLLADLRQNRVTGEDLGAATEVVVPVRRPLHLHRLAGDQAPRRRDRHLLAQRGVGQVLVVVGPRLVVVVDGRHLRVGENRGELLDPPTGAQPQPAALVPDPAALPSLLVLVGPRIALPRAGFHIVEPHVLDAGPVGPGLFAGHRTGVAPDALVQVHHHRQLSHHAHQYCTSCERRRTMVTSSR